MFDFLTRRPGYDAEIFAEARSLMDDGLDADFVLGLYPGDEDWLAPLLDTGAAITGVLADEQPSYYFEASLKAKFLAAAREAAEPAVIAPAPLAPLRTALAGFSVVGAAAAIGAVTLGFITAGNAVPGDWNYSFKLANERVQYTLSRGDDRISIQLHQSEARVRELRQTSSSGSVSTADVERLQHELTETAQLLSNQPIGTDQKARVKDLVETSTAALNDLKIKNPSLATAIGTAENSVASVGAAAGIGTPTPLITPEPTPTASPAPAPAPSATPASEPSSPTPTATP
jgi:hypothetical protein